MNFFFRMVSIAILIVTSTIMVFCSSSPAKTIRYDFTGTLSQVHDQNTSILSSNGIAAGDTVSGAFEYNDTPDSTTYPSGINGTIASYDYVQGFNITVSVTNSSGVIFKFQSYPTFTAGSTEWTVSVRNGPDPYNPFPGMPDYDEFAINSNGSLFDLTVANDMHRQIFLCLTDYNGNVFSNYSLPTNLTLTDFQSDRIDVTSTDGSSTRAELKIDINTLTRNTGCVALKDFLDPNSGNINPTPDAGDMSGNTKNANINRLDNLMKQVGTACSSFNNCDIADSIQQLENVLKHTDGVNNDWIIGPTATVLRSTILDVIDEIRAQDCDGDGVNNGVELDNGTDPADPLNF